MFELPNMPGASVGAISLGDHLRQGVGRAQQGPGATSVKDAHEPLLAEESDKLLDQDQVVQEAIREVENNGIVFLDEIDKICAREHRGGADVSREGVQRDLLPLIEGTKSRPSTARSRPIIFCSSPPAHSIFPNPPICCPNCKAGCRSGSSSCR